MPHDLQAPATPGTGRTKQPLILVVDDVETNRQLVCRRLAVHGYDLHALDSGEAALAFIATRQPDLVLLDYMMPAMSGLEVLRSLRQDWRYAGLPVIMLTARTQSESVVAALEAGADDYVTKPIDFDVLKARIETQLVKMRRSEGLLEANAALDERATMRLLAFDELRDELAREIELRCRAEKALHEMSLRLRACEACGGLGEAPAARIDAAQLLADCRSAEAAAARPAANARALEIIDALARAAEKGQYANPALIAALREQVSGLTGPAPAA